VAGGSHQEHRKGQFLPARKGGWMTTALGFVVLILAFAGLLCSETGRRFLLLIYGYIPLVVLGGGATIVGILYLLHVLGGLESKMSGIAALTFAAFCGFFVVMKIAQFASGWRETNKQTAKDALAIALLIPALMLILYGLSTITHQTSLDPQ
jgi:hypothetical protein